MKIGLIAMSGIRVVEPGLLELGLTLPGFVERGQVIASLPSLGLLTLAGMTSADHECRYVEVADIRTLDALPDDFDLVALSSFTAQIGEAYALADRYRSRGTPVVLGGLHATAMPDEAALHCDSVVVGEGEPVWNDVLQDVDRGALQPLYRAPYEFDLADAPVPAFELLDVERYNRLTVQASRGCPFRCEFCASSILLTARYKQKPVDRVLAEIDRIRERWPRPFIEFADDNAFVDRRYWKRLLPRLARRRVRWFAETDLSIWDDAELLELMRESGCTEVLVGLESPDRPPLRRLETRADRKRWLWPHYHRAIERIQSHGIRVNACFVLGLDGQRRDIFDRIERFVVEARPFDVQVTIQTPFPGSMLRRRLLGEGRLSRHASWDHCTLFDVTFTPQEMSAAELRAGLEELVRRLYGEQAMRRRRASFRRQARRRKMEGAAS